MFFKTYRVTARVRDSIGREGSASLNLTSICSLNKPKYTLKIEEALREACSSDGEFEAVKIEIESIIRVG